MRILQESLANIFRDVMHEILVLSAERHACCFKQYLQDAINHKWIHVRCGLQPSDGIISYFV